SSRGCSAGAAHRSAPKGVRHACTQGKNLQGTRIRSSQGPRRDLGRPDREDGRPAGRGVIKTSVLALLVLLATSGCSALAGRPLETWAQDRGLTARVKARLAATDAVTLTRIHVDTYEGIVYLTGGVTSLDTKRNAEEIARSVPGVEQVVNNIHL